jgi:hypothetical protein
MHIFIFFCQYIYYIVLFKLEFKDIYIYSSFHLLYRSQRYANTLGHGYDTLSFKIPLFDLTTLLVIESCPVYIFGFEKNGFSYHLFKSSFNFHEKYISAFSSLVVPIFLLE